MPANDNANLNFHPYEKRARLKLTDGLFLFASFFLLAAALTIYLHTTQKGLGLVSDSVNYLNAARFIAAGEGYYRESGGGTLKPVTNFPPLYSIILSLPILAGADQFQAARGVGAVFWILNLVLIGLIVRKISGSRWLGLAAAVLFMASKPFLEYQSFAMSESVFFFCTLAGILSFLAALERDRTVSWLLTGFLCGAAVLARYVGIVSLAVVLFCLLFLRPEKIRLFRASLWTLAGATPLIAGWLIRNRIVSGNLSNRSAGIHLLPPEDLSHGALIWVRWLLPGRYDTVERATPWMIWLTAILLAGFVLYLLGMIFIRFSSRPRLEPETALITFCAAYIPAYLLAVWATISFLDASVNIEERILYPCQMMFLIMLFGIFALLRKNARIRSLASVFFILFLLIPGLLSAMETSRFIRRYSTDGYGWGWEGWQSSPAMKILEKLPREKVIYSNQPEAVSLHAGRGAYALLDPIDPSSEALREGYWETLEKIRAEVMAGKSVLAFFGMEAWLPEGETNWISTLTEGLPAIYRDTSEWVLGIED